MGSVQRILRLVALFHHALHLDTVGETLEGHIDAVATPKQAAVIMGQINRSIEKRQQLRNLAGTRRALLLAQMVYDVDASEIIPRPPPVPDVTDAQTDTSVAPAQDGALPRTLTQDPSARPANPQEGSSASMISLLERALSIGNTGGNQRLR